MSRDCRSLEQWGPFTTSDQFLGTSFSSELSRCHGRLTTNVPPAHFCPYMRFEHRGRSAFKERVIGLSSCLHLHHGLFSFFPSAHLSSLRWRRVAISSTLTMQAHPLIPPHIAPGCWPEATDEDKKAALYQLKQTRWMNAGIESCVSKGILAGVAGAFLPSQPKLHIAVSE